MLGRWGDGGIWHFFDGDCSLDFDGLDGGVKGRLSSKDLWEDPDIVGELNRGQK